MTPATEALCAQVRAAIVRIGWTETSRLSGVPRETLHNVFPPTPRSRLPNLATLDKVVGALGLRLSLTRGEQG